MKINSNNTATNNQVFVLCATQTMNSHQTENCTRFRPDSGADFHYIGLINPTG